jgi:hypothetical protein
MARRKRVTNPILEHIPREGIKPIKVRLDHRTIITVQDMKKFEEWKKRYPKAEVIKD